MALVGEAAEDDQRGFIEGRLEQPPVGVVAEAQGHGAVGGGDHAVDRSNGVAFEIEHGAGLGGAAGVVKR